MDFQHLRHGLESGTQEALESWLARASADLSPEEIYCQIGCEPGDGLVAALQAYPIGIAYLVEEPEWVDIHPESIEVLSERLTDLDLQDRVVFCSQNFEEFFADLGATDSPPGIGVFFYSGATDYRSQLLSLILAANFLADRAVIVVNRTRVGAVRQAVGDFLASYSAARLELESEQGFWILSWDTAAQLRDANPSWDQPRSVETIAALHALQHDRQEQALAQLRDQAIQLHFEYQYTAAEAKYRAYLNHCPTNAEVWGNLGMLCYLNQQNQAALSALQRSLDLNPDNAVAHHICGMVSERLEQPDQAIGAYQNALRLNPNDQDVLNQLGKLYLEQENWQSAAELFQQAIALSPEHFAGYLNLGDLWVAQAQPEQAIPQYLKALSLKRQTPEILHKLGESYAAIGDLAQSNNYLAYAHYRSHEYETAIDYFQRFFEISQTGTFSDYFALYNSLYSCGDVETAIAALRSAAKFCPDDRFFLSQIECVLPSIYQSQAEILQARQSYFQALATVAEEYDRSIAMGDPIDIGFVGRTIHFQLAYQGLNDRPILEIHGRLLHAEMSRLHPQWAQPLALKPLKAREKIRVGYLALDLSNNSATRWALGWLKQHDRSQFEIYSYSIGSKSDSKTEQFKLASDVFWQLPTIDAAAAQVRSDDLHILVFLVVGASPAMTNIAALRLAPVQCSAWGHPVTSGIPTVDYFLSGDWMEPPNAQEHYTEQLVRLPNLGISYPQPPFSPPSKTRADFGLPEDAVLYFCCQLIYKYLPQHDYLLVEIIRRVPKSRLIFVPRSTGNNGITQGIKQQFLQRLRKAFATAGLKFEDHCFLLPAQDWDSYTSLLHCVDVFLDTVDFSGGHTTFDAIACNLPIVTLPGELMRGRQSYGMLQMLGVTDTIAQTEADYIDIAVRLGMEPDWRAAISAQMSRNHAKLFNDSACVTGLETFYRQVVNRDDAKTYGANLEL